MSIFSRFLRARTLRVSRPNFIRFLFVGLLITTIFMFIGTERAFRKQLKKLETNPTDTKLPTVKKLLSSEVDDLLKNVSLEVASDQCQFLIHGSASAVDDRGNICSWHDLDISSGCCKTLRGSRNLTKGFCNDTNQCDKSTHCCQKYQMCVSCCIRNDKQELASLVKEYPVLSHSNSVFDLCTAACRTNSKSVFHENAYRSNYKYCFGISPPPLIPRTHRWLMLDQA